MSAPSMTGRVRAMSAHPRAYLSTRPVAHVLPWGSNLADGEPAFCGVQPGIELGWRGDANAIERDIVAALPLCFTCERFRRRPHEAPQPDPED